MLIKTTIRGIYYNIKCSIQCNFSSQKRILRAVHGKGTTDGQGLCVQEIPQEGWQESAEGSQE